MIFEPGHHSDFPPLKHVRSIYSCDSMWRIGWQRSDRSSLCAWMVGKNHGARTRKCFTAIIDLAAFRYSLPVLKIYSIRYVHYRFSVLAVSIGTSVAFSCPDPRLIEIFPSTYAHRNALAVM